MTIATLAQRAGAILARLGAWAGRRARERSTWAGLSTLAVAFGFRELSDRIDHVANALTLLGLVSGVALSAATTSQHPPTPPALQP